LHAGTARDLVHALKFSGNLAAARPLAALAGAAARELDLAPDVVVVPVPLHWQRRRKRGFNQATEIARWIAREHGRALRPRWLRRVRAGESSRMRTRSGRRREIRGAFRAHPGAANRKVLLIDDVLTTGATLGACARALARRGAAEIYAVTATRAP
jgi:ComF family protein